MNYLASALYLVGPLSVGALALLLAVLGKRLGQALELPPYYKLYYASSFFFLLPLPAGAILVFAGSWGLPEPSHATGLAIKAVAVSLPLGVALTLAVFATAKYWGWIWRELESSRRKDGKNDVP